MQIRRTISNETQEEYLLSITDFQMQDIFTSYINVTVNAFLKHNLVYSFNISVQIGENLTKLDIIGSESYLQCMRLVEWSMCTLL